MNKRGISHIEVMLSFLIFVGFVIFALYFFSPIKSSRLVETSLTYAFDEVRDYSTVVLESYSVSIPVLAAVSGDTIAINLGSSLQNINSRVEDYQGNVIGSSAAGGTVYFLVDGSTYGSGSGFAVIKLSDDFEAFSGAAIGTPGVDPSLYDLASSNTVEIVSEKKISDLVGSYAADYSGLKESFNLPNRANFGFGLVFDVDDKIETNRELPRGVDVFSNRERIEVLRADGKTEFGDLVVKIW